MQQEWVLGVVAGAFHGRQTFQRHGRGHKVPGVRPTVPGQGGQAFEVAHPGQRHAKRLKAS